MKAAIILAAALLSSAAAPGPHKVVRNTPALEFSYQWPQEAAAVPALDLRLYSEAKRDLARASRDAGEDQTLARAAKREFHPHYYSKKWSTSGDTDRLLSLEAALEAYTGGAHPEHGNAALLWDRRRNNAIAVERLFLRRDAFAAVTRAGYCRALDRERLKRRQGETLEGMFSDCPKYAELEIALTDRNRNGRFDTIALVASPYVAGPYAEGAYVITLPVTSQLIRAIRPEYRASFERQRQ